MTKSNIDQFVAQNLPWTFLVNLVDITFITLGLSLISREPIMSLFVSELTASKIAIGLVPASFSLSFYLPQLFVASWTERLTLMKPFVALTSGMLERGPYLLMGLAAWAFAARSPEVTLVAISGMGAGDMLPAWFTIIGKVLPVHRRGIFFDVSGGLGALMGIVGAHFVGLTLETAAFQDNLAWLFIIAFAFTIVTFGM